MGRQNIDGDKIELIHKIYVTSNEYRIRQLCDGNNVFYCKTNRNLDADEGEGMCVIYSIQPGQSICPNFDIKKLE
jgi:hypothetical protein